MFIDSGWARADSRTSRMRHYFIGGRSLCRLWGVYSGIRYDQKQKPGQDCIRCLKTLRTIDKELDVAEV